MITAHFCGFFFFSDKSVNALPRLTHNIVSVVDITLVLLYRLDSITHTFILSISLFVCLVFLCFVLFFITSIENLFYLIRCVFFRSALFKAHLHLTIRFTLLFFLPISLTLLSLAAVWFDPICITDSFTIVTMGCYLLLSRLLFCLGFYNLNSHTRVHVSVYWI